MRYKIVCGTVATAVMMTAVGVTPAFAAFTSGCISGTACFRKSSNPTVQKYTSSSDSSTLADLPGYDNIRQRMSTYELYLYEYENYQGFDGCYSPEGSAAPWRAVAPPIGSEKVLNIDGC